MNPELEITALTDKQHTSRDHSFPWSPWQSRLHSMADHSLPLL